MDANPEKLSRTLWIGVGLLIVVLCLSFVLSRLPSRSGHGAKLPVLGQVSDFALTNQAGQLVTLADLRGRVWVGDIIFTRCAGPCPRMTAQMRSLQEALPKEDPARLVTLTTDPVFDTPEVLAKYAAHFQADTNRWMFLTGTKSQIAALAIDGLKLTSVEKQPAERTDEADLFIHSTFFVLVDKEARLRGIFETSGEGVEWTNVRPAILKAVRQLEHER